MPKQPKAIRVLAVASGGGHWVQLMRLRPAWQGCDVAYLTTNRTYATELRMQAEQDKLPPPRFHLVGSANRWQKLRLLGQLFAICWIVARERPGVVITTGASPGYFAVLFGRLLGARTIWIDSIANCEEVSLAGRKAGQYADLWLTQWENVSQSTEVGGRRPEYWGGVL
jgi:UDP-N-acetylglucosamine:LPS N-acetylglucosamine transferase